MNRVYTKVHFDVIDNCPKFFEKLKAFVGEIRIEQQQITDNDCITVSFYTDKVEIKEGEPRQVEIEAMYDEKGDWNFTRIVK